MKIDEAFGIHEHALRLRAARAEVLAANLANADTPGYKARDVDFAAVLRREVPGTVRLAATQPGHLGRDDGVLPASQLLYRTPTQPSVDGNTVDVAREQVAFSQNGMEYQASLRFLEGRIRSLLTAIKGE